MEAPDNVVVRYDKMRGFISAWLGVILTIIAVLIMFIVASLEGTREIKASSAENGRLLTQWREEHNVPNGFPESRVTTIERDGSEYYFIVTDVHPETGDVLDWYWAYDGGIRYVLSDPRYYALASITIMFSFFVAYVNYNSTTDKGMQTEKFQDTMLLYKSKKKKVAGHTHLIPAYCTYKYKEAYIEIKRAIVEGADIDWNLYNSEKFDINALEKWQQKALKKIKKIKIIRMTPRELLFEQKPTNGTVRLLPEGQSEHRRSFLIKGTIVRLITTFAGGLVAGFGIIMGNWVLGVVFGFTILLSAIGSVVSAADYVMNTLRNRYIGKSSYLEEFDNMKDRFIGGEENDGQIPR